MPIGPGDEASLQAGIDEAIKLANIHELQVIPVNAEEAAIMSSASDCTQPQLSVLSSSWNTQLVTSTGLGQHEILGLRLDSSVETVIDSLSAEITRSLCRIDKIEMEVKDLLRQIENKDDRARADSFFNNLIPKKDINFPQGTFLINNLARYGNPECFDLRLPLEHDLSCNLSFTGIKTQTTSFFYEQNDIRTGVKMPLKIRPRRDLSLVQIINLAASFQSNIFSQFTSTITKAINYC